MWARHLEWIDGPSYLEADEGDNPEEGNSAETAFTPQDGDWRASVFRQIKARRGQQTFRDAVRERYGDGCMICECVLMDVVEAAHIKPYRALADNHPANGLLLRADLHTLFDLDLIGMSLEYTRHHARYRPGKETRQDHRSSEAEAYPAWHRGLPGSPIQAQQGPLVEIIKRIIVSIQAGGDKGLHRLVFLPATGRIPPQYSESGCTACGLLGNTLAPSVVGGQRRVFTVSGMGAVLSPFSFDTRRGSADNAVEPGTTSRTGESLYRFWIMCMRLIGAANTCWPWLEKENGRPRLTGPA